MTVKQSTLGFWFVMLNGDPISGGTLDRQLAIKEMEMMR